jgi:hypothetical protein
MLYVDGTRIHVGLAVPRGCVRGVALVLLLQLSLPYLTASWHDISTVLPLPPSYILPSQLGSRIRPSGPPQTGPRAT